VAPIRWDKASWWPRDIFETVLKECPALEVLGHFYFRKGDMECKSSLPRNSFPFDFLFIYLAVVMALPKLREITLDASPFYTRPVCPCVHDTLNEAKGFPLPPGIYT